MLKDIRYKFNDFEVISKNNDLFLKPVSKNYDFEQLTLFTYMLNFGYIGFNLETFSVTSKNIVSFWNYLNSTGFNNYSLEKYYSLLNLGKIYDERVPSLKTEGSFNAKDFKLTVVWVKTDTKMYSQSIAYNQVGLKLKELEFDDVIGSIYPEYFELYSKVDEANLNWKDWSNKEKYEFLEEIEEHSKKRKIILPQNLVELLNRHKNENSK